MTGAPRYRLLLLLPTTTYRAGAFIAAADAIDADLFQTGSLSEEARALVFEN